MSKFLGVLSAALLTGCSQLPVDGPAYRDIASGAATALLVDRHAIAYDYALVDLSQTVIESLSDFGPGSLFKTFGEGHGPAPVIRVGVGDVLQVAVFESSAGGLFIPAEAGVRPGNFVTIPNQSVSRSGTVKIPYAGEIQAAGRTIQEIQRDIEGDRKSTRLNSSH